MKMGRASECSPETTFRRAPLAPILTVYTSRAWYELPQGREGREGGGVCLRRRFGDGFILRRF
jgi:hypothetical protein